MRWTIGVLSAACVSAACGGPAAPVTPVAPPKSAIDLAHVGVRWEIADATCVGDDCPGGVRVDVTLVVTQGGTTQRRALGKAGQLTADADDGPVGARRCRVALTDVACSGTPEQNQISIAIEKSDLVVTRLDWVDDPSSASTREVARVHLAGVPPYQIIPAPR